MVNPDHYDHVTLANEYKKSYGNINAVQPVSTIQQLVRRCPTQFSPFIGFITFVQHDFLTKAIVDNINYRLDNIEHIKYYRIQHNNKFQLTCCDVIQIVVNGSYNKQVYDYEPMPKQDMDYLVGGLLLDYQRRKYRVCDRRLSLVKEQGESYTCEKFPLVKKKSSKLAISAINSSMMNMNNLNINNNNTLYTRSSSGNNNVLINNKSVNGDSSCENSSIRRGADVNCSVIRTNSGIDDEFVKHSVSYTTSTDYKGWNNKMKSISPEASMMYFNGGILKAKSTRIASNLVKKKSSKIDVEQDSSNSDDIVTNPVSRVPSKIEPFIQPRGSTKLPPIQSCL